MTNIPPKISHRYLLPLLIIPALCAFNAAARAQPPVVIKTYGQHLNGNIVYYQQVMNTGNRNVVAVAIGHDTDYIGQSSPASKSIGKLAVLPIGSDIFDLEIKPGAVSGPSGWTAKIVQIQDSGRFLEWRRPPYQQSAIQPRQTLSFSVTVSAQDNAYLTGHFSARHADGKEPWAYNGVMERLDTTPPTLAVNATPNTLWPPNHKLVNVVANIAVKDDYDPNPEIKLESITVNEAIDPAKDIQGAQFGGDDRQFSLNANREGSNKAGRIYTITYSATDASGNKAATSATVTVPHDQGK